MTERDDLASERVAELAEALRDSGIGRAYPDVAYEAAQVVAPLVARWLAEVEAQRHPLWGDGFLAGKERGATEVRARVEAAEREIHASGERADREWTAHRDMYQAGRMEAYYDAVYKLRNALAEPGDQNGEAK